MGLIADLYARLALRQDKASFDRGHHALESLKHGLEAFVGFEALKKVGETVKGWVEHTTEIGTHAAEAAEKLGITAEAVQELGFAAKQTGVDQGSLETGLGRLAKNLDIVATKGSGPAADALERLGLHAKDFQGLNLDQSFSLISERLNTIPDGIKKIGISKDLFGKTGQEIIPLTKNLEELRAQAETTGNVIGGEDAEALKEFSREQLRMGAQLDGLKNQVVVGLLPSLRSMVEGLREWIAENKEVIKSGIQGAIEALATAFKAVGTVFTEVIVPMMEFLKEHGDIAEALFYALAAAAAVFGASVALAWLEAAAPFIVIGAAIAAVIFAVKKLSGWWDKMGTKGKIIMGALSLVIMPIVGVVLLLTKAVQYLAEHWESVADAAERAWNLIKKIADIPGQVVGEATGLTQGFNADGTPKGGPAVPAPSVTPQESQTAGATHNGDNTLNITVQGGTNMNPHEFKKAIQPHVQNMFDTVIRGAAD